MFLQFFYFYSKPKCI